MVNEQYNITIKDSILDEKRVVYGQDQSGNLVYVDYSSTNSSKFVEKVFKDISDKLPISGGINMINNEIEN